MVAAYYMQDPVANQCDPCTLDPPEPVDGETLAKVGVWTKKIPIEGDWEHRLDDVASENGLKHRDEVVIHRDKLPNYDQKLKMFFEEHLHTDPEVRFIKDGTGFFDVRDASDRWIRIVVKEGDLLFLPAGLYHRFTVDTHDFVHAIRLFKDEPKWEAFNRSEDVDKMSAREEFLEEIVKN